MGRTVAGIVIGYIIGKRVAEMQAFNVEQAVQRGIDQWMHRTSDILEDKFAPEPPIVPPPRISMGSQDPLGNRQGFGRLVRGHAPLR